MMPLALSLLLAFALGCMVGELAAIDRRAGDLPRARATWRQRRAWKRERLQGPTVPNSWRRV
jgi:hypothetical protein